MRTRPITSFSLRLGRNAPHAVARWLTHVSRRFGARLTFVEGARTYEAALDVVVPIAFAPACRALLEANLVLLGLAAASAGAPPRSSLGGRR